LLPALSQAKEAARRISCLNNLRQLSLSRGFDADDSESAYPLRTAGIRWPSRLQGSFRDVRVLRCPTDVGKTRPPTPPATGLGDTNKYPADVAPRSYIINGWNDYFKDSLSEADFSAYMAGQYMIPLTEPALLQTSVTSDFCENN